MGISCGLVGLPNAGKSTLFNALTSASVPAEAYPFCTVDPHTGVAVVPDERLLRLEKLLNPDHVIPDTLEFIDIAGLVEGSHRGEGLGNQFLSHIRDVDLIIHLVRGFSSSEVAHPVGTIQPARDYRIVRRELIQKDLEILTRRFEKLNKMAKVGDRTVCDEIDLIHALTDQLQAGEDPPVVPSDTQILSDLVVLSLKPELVVLNMGEEHIPDAAESMLKILTEAGIQAMAVSAKLESELSELETSESIVFRKEMGLSEHGVRELIAESRKRLGLITFFTTAGGILQAWSTRQGSTAFDAAGMIHTDIQKGFIRAEVFRLDDLETFQSEHALKEHGLIRTEGKQYQLNDGDIILFRHRN